LEEDEAVEREVREGEAEVVFGVCEGGEEGGADEDEDERARYGGVGEAGGEHGGGWAAVGKSMRRGG
jgi:hypothetical protein